MGVGRLWECCRPYIDSGEGYILGKRVNSQSVAYILVYSGRYG